MYMQKSAEFLFNLHNLKCWPGSSSHRRRPEVEQHGGVGSSDGSIGGRRLLLQHHQVAVRGMLRRSSKVS